MESLLATCRNNAYFDVLEGNILEVYRHVKESELTERLMNVGNIHEVYDYVKESDLTEKLMNAMRATFHALAAWWQVALVIGGPPVRYCWRWQLSLDGRALAIEGVCLATLIFLIILRRFLRRKKYLIRFRRYIRVRWGNLKAAYAAVKRRYNRFIAHVVVKSKLAAQAIPHICFMVAVGTGFFLFPKTAHQLWTSSNIEVSMIVLRASQSILAIADYTTALSRKEEKETERKKTLALPKETPKDATKAMTPSPLNWLSISPFKMFSPSNNTINNRNNNNNYRTPLATPKKMTSSLATGERRRRRTHGENDGGGDDDDVISAAASKVLRDCLIYWVVFSMIVTTQRLTSYLPFFGQFAADHSHLKTMYAILLVWLQLPLGCPEILYRALVPIMERYTGKIRPKLHIDSTQTSTMLKGLIMFRVLTNAQYDMLMEICRDGWVLILGAAFIFTPWFITRVGCLLVGLVYPAFCAVLLIHKAESSKEKDAASLSMIRWLKYWVVYAVYMSLGQELGRSSLNDLLFMVPQNHVNLVFLVWLQLPFCRGAPLVYEKGGNMLLKAVLRLFLMEAKEESTKSADFKLAISDASDACRSSEPRAGAQLPGSLPGSRDDSNDVMSKTPLSVNLQKTPIVVQPENAPPITDDELHAADPPPITDDEPVSQSETPSGREGRDSLTPTPYMPVAPTLNMDACVNDAEEVDRDVIAKVGSLSKSGSLLQVEEATQPTASSPHITGDELRPVELSQYMVSSPVSSDGPL